MNFASQKVSMSWSIAILDIISDISIVDLSISFRLSINPYHTPKTMVPSDEWTFCTNLGLFTSRRPGLAFMKIGSTACVRLHTFSLFFLSLSKLLCLFSVIEGSAYSTIVFNWLEMYTKWHEIQYSTEGSTSNLKL